MTTRLQNTDKPLILYGTGNGAEKIIDSFSHCGIKIADIFVSDRFSRGQEFRGYKVKTFNEIKKLYSEFIILVGFATRENDVMEYIYALDAQYELYVPDAPVYGKNIFDTVFFNRYKNLFKKTSDMLSDDKSKETYENIIRFKLTGELKYLKSCESDKTDAYRLLDLNNSYVYADCGSYDGDTIREVLDFTGGLKRVFAFEPDVKNFNKLRNYINNNHLNDYCRLFNMGVWSREGKAAFSSEESRNSSLCGENNKMFSAKVGVLDNIIKEKVDLIKYDVEGAEYEALDGSIKTIRKYKPKLIVSLYHRSEDLYKLPLFINKIHSDYQFYIKKHRYIPAWDVNLYAIPRE